LDKDFWTKSKTGEKITMGKLQNPSGTLWAFYRKAAKHPLTVRTFDESQYSKGFQLFKKVTLDGSLYEFICEKQFVKTFENDETNQFICDYLDIEEGEFSGQKIFKNFFIESTNDDQAVKDYRMFLNIDANAGGKIRALRRKPNDEDLSKYLINKSMIVVVGMMNDKNAKKQRTNLIIQNFGVHANKLLKKSLMYILVCQSAILL
jgi:hypothetical protein